MTSLRLLRSGKSLPTPYDKPSPLPFFFGLKLRTPQRCFLQYLVYSWGNGCLCLNTWRLYALSLATQSLDPPGGQQICRWSFYTYPDSHHLSLPPHLGLPSDSWFWRHTELGSTDKPTTCVGCEGHVRPSSPHHLCIFASTGFPLGSSMAIPCVMDARKLETRFAPVYVIKQARSSPPWSMFQTSCVRHAQVELI